MITFSLDLINDILDFIIKPFNGIYDIPLQTKFPKFNNKPPLLLDL